jgi:hypothetical protein
MATELLELARVVLAPPQHDDRVRLLAAELYTDGLVLRYVMPGGIQIPRGGEPTIYFAH